MNRDLIRQLLAAGVFFGIVFGLAFLHKASGAPRAAPSSYLEGTVS